MAVSSPPVPIGVGIVADRRTSGAALAEVVRSDPRLRLLGVTDRRSGDTLLRDLELRVLIVNLPLTASAGVAPGIAFIREAKRRRPDVRVLSLKRLVDEHQLRAALDAGADACCLAVAAGARLCKAIQVVADGATWLDPEVTGALFHRAESDARPPAARLSPREAQILRLLVEGYTNDEIAEHLGCAYPTVRTHLAHLYRKIEVGDRVSAAVYALRRGLDS